jgi:hypothetical protein
MKKESFLALIGIMLIICLGLTGCPSPAGGDDPADKTALTAAIGEAEAAKTGVTASATDPGAGTKWVLPADSADFEAAINAARAVKDKAGATQTEVDNDSGKYS